MQRRKPAKNRKQWKVWRRQCVWRAGGRNIRGGARWREFVTGHGSEAAWDWVSGERELETATPDPSAVQAVNSAACSVVRSKEWFNQGV